MVKFVSILCVLGLGISVQAETTKSGGQARAERRKLSRLKSFTNSQLESCGEFNGAPLPSPLTKLQVQTVKNQLLEALRKAGVKINQDTKLASQELRDCLGGRLARSCEANKKKFLRESNADLKELRLLAHLWEVEHKLHISSVFDRKILSDPISKIRYPGTNITVAPLKASERIVFQKRIEDIEEDSLQAYLKTAGACATGSRGKKKLKSSPLCRAQHEREIEKRLVRSVQAANFAGREKSELLLLENPWLKVHKKPTLEKQKVLSTLSDMVTTNEANGQTLDKLTLKEMEDYLALKGLVSGVVASEPDPLQRQLYCSIAEAHLKRQRSFELAKTTGLLGTAIAGLALCPMTAGLTCGAVATGASAGLGGSHLLDSYKNYNKSIADHSSGIIDSESLIEQKESFRNDLLMVAAAGVSTPVSSLRAAAKVFRNTGFKAAAGRTLTGPEMGRVARYMIRNPENGKKIEGVNLQAAKLKTKMPGHLPGEDLKIIQDSIPRLIANVGDDLPIKIVEDLEEMLGLLGKSTRGTDEYKKILGDIQLRTKLIEVFAKKPASKTFDQHLDDAISRAGFPKGINGDIKKCFRGVARRQVGRVHRNFFIESAHAAGLGNDDLCNVPIAKILNNQSPKGFKTNANGVQVRYFIEKWACKDCGTEDLPAWVRVQRETGEKDLAQVTHCVSCGNPKEKAEAYYENWQRDSRGRIINAGDDEITEGGAAQRTAKRAAESEDVSKSDKGYCGFCGTLFPMDAKSCGSCGAASMNHLVTNPGHSPLRPPKTPREQAAKPRKQERSSYRSRNGRVRGPVVSRNSSRSRGGNSSSSSSSSELTSSGGLSTRAKVGIGAGVAAAGGAGYYAFKPTDVEAVVYDMKWKHTVNQDRYTPVSKREWRDSIRLSEPVMPVNGRGEHPGAKNINSCREEVHHQRQVACGTETYTISGSCTSSSSNGITTQSCSPDTTGTRTKYCPEPVYKTKCSYETYEWRQINSKFLSGGPPSSAGPLPWPNIEPGRVDRLRRVSDYRIFTEFNAFGKDRKDDTVLNSEAEFQTWKVGNKLEITFRRATGASNPRRIGEEK